MICIPRLFADDTCLLIGESIPEKLQCNLGKDIISVYNYCYQFKDITSVLQFTI